jgi:thiol-disulfide isomerase/thioredoxin
MKHLSAGVLLVVLVLFSCNKDEKTNTLAMGDFEISTNKIIQNQPFTITYNGDSTLEENVFFNIVQSKPYAYDLNFNENKAVITIPDSVSAVSFHFKTDGKYDDNNKDGYLYPIYNNNGEVAKGANAAMEYHKLGNGGDFGLKGSEESNLIAIEKAVSTYPELKKNWRRIHIQLAGKENKDKAQKLAESYISEITAKTNLTEDDYSQVSSIYASLRNRKAMDSISEIAMAKFPKGKAKQQALMNSFYDAKTLAEKEKVFNEIETNFGMSPSLTYAASNLATQKFDAGDQAGFKLYESKISGNMEKAGLYNSIAWPAAEAGKNMKIASKLSKNSLDLVMEAKKDLSKKPPYYTEKQYVKNIESSYNMFADTYALLQYKLGNVKEAITYQAQAVGDGKSAEVNDRYIEFLVADKQYKLAAEKANDFLSEGNGSAKMKADYKTAYTNLNAGAKGFDTVMAAIDQTNHDRELAVLKESMLDEVAPQFTLKNLDGEAITLADLKGKTVILDFWATWCGPCKASFPGMQEVVEKYKDNDNVVLLFVDTFEDGKNREKDVAKFIKDNKYDFHVLIDGKVKDSNDYEVAKKYGITGIPTKIIIGPSGKINFRAVGFSGNNDKLKQEIDLMIDLLKV